jgi:hypothetical protein
VAAADYQTDPTPQCTRPVAAVDRSRVQRLTFIRQRTNIGVRRVLAPKSSPAPTLSSKHNSQFVSHAAHQAQRRPVLAISTKGTQ